MKKLSVFFVLFLLSFAGSSFTAQTKKPDAKKTAAAKRTPTPAKKNTAASKTASRAKPVEKRDPKADLEKALQIESPVEKAAALTKFLNDHKESELRLRALESLTAARFLIAESKFEAGERETAVGLYRTAVKEAPIPYSERLFNEVIAKAPQALYFRGEQAAAAEIATSIEGNVAASAPHLLALAGSFLMMENGEQAKRLAEAALKIDESSTAAYQVLGMGYRLNFDLESSAATFAKALELDPGSTSSKRSLAEMKRALGKHDEALLLFDELLAKDPEDFGARNGRILALFDAGKIADAQNELAKAIESNPSNVPLIAGAAYWYAANGDSSKAIDLAGKAIAADPRFIWSHIALARAYLLENRFTDAEQVLLKARSYGNFPTLEYEIATARLTGGFYREAADELRKSFVIKDGMVVTKLGRRVERAERTFTDLISYERRASILEPKSAEAADQAEQLRALLEFQNALSAAGPDPTKAADLADAFAKGNDKMRFHRQIYAANELLEKKIAPAKAIELSKAAIASVDDGLNVASAAAPIMANELYAGRVAAINADRYLLVPDVPKQTLSAIARGRIEEIAGRSLLLQGNNAEAAIRLRRAVSILPEKSAWWRSSYWLLGQSLEADGKDKDALDAYVKSYGSGEPDGAKYGVIENLYEKANGGSDGLEALIGANPTRPEEPKPADKVSTAEVISTEKVEGSTALPSAPKAEPNVETSRQDEKPVAATESAKQETTEGKPAANEEVKAEPKPQGEKPVSIAETKPQDKSESRSPTAAEAKPEARPGDEKPAVATDTKSEEKADSNPVPIQEKSPDSKPEEEKPTDSKKPQTEPKKNLFDPVVIEIKTPAPKTDKPVVEIVGEEKKTEDPLPDDKSPAARLNERPRLIEGKEVRTDEPPPCNVTVSQENISLIGGGGSVGILVGIEGRPEPKDLTAASSSPKDIEIVADTDIAASSGKHLFVIKSLTPSTGVYQVTFAAPCGKKALTVKVR